MIEQPHEDAAANRRALHRKSQNIYIVAMLILFCGYLFSTPGMMFIWMFSSLAEDGTNLSALIGLTVAAIPFLLFALLLYKPATGCLIRFLDKENTKRFGFLAVALIPYIVCLFLTFGWTHAFILLPMKISYAVAEVQFPKYEKLYRDNAALLNRLNDTLLNWEGRDDTWWLRSIHTWESNDEISVTLSGNYSDEYGYTYPPLEIVNELSEQDKQDIRTLLENMSVNNGSLSFKRNHFEFRINGAWIHFIKPEGFKNYEVDGKPLGDGWYFCTGSNTPSVNEAYHDYLAEQEQNPTPPEEIPASPKDE